MPRSVKTYLAQMRCMFCDCLLGYKAGFLDPGLTTHGLGDCCKEFAKSWYGGNDESHSRKPEVVSGSDCCHFDSLPVFRHERPDGHIHNSETAA